MNIWFFQLGSYLISNTLEKPQNKMSGTNTLWPVL
jgi:hypothetical protein